MKSPRTHFILACIIGAAVFVGYGMWYAAVASESRSVADLQNQVDTASADVSRIASARAALAEISGDEAKVQAYFVSGSGVVSFINDLEARGLAEKTTVNVLSVSTGNSPGISTLLFSLTVKGTFNAVMRTVGSIEYAPYDLSVAALSVEQDGKNSWHADLNLIVGSVSLPVATSTP